MSTPAQKANLARIRDNQRRSRARKREYLQELEQRLRICEHQGIEASAEVQVAARRVAEENARLRELLHKQGVTDEYIAHYLQASLIAPDLNPQLGSGLPGPAVQAMQQLLVPRRPNPLDPASAAAAAAAAAVTGSGAGAYSMAGAGQTSREASVTSASTSASSLWESPPQGHGGSAHSQGQMYSSSGSATPRVDSFTGQTPRQQTGVGVGMMDAVHHGHPQQHQGQQQQHNHHHHAHHQHHQQQQHQHQQHQAFSQQQVQAAIQAGALGYGNPNVPSYHQDDAQNYGPGGGYC